jgi:hypothetical protein
MFDLGAVGRAYCLTDKRTFGQSAQKIMLEAAESPTKILIAESFCNGDPFDLFGEQSLYGAGAVIDAFPFLIVEFNVVGMSNK